MRQDVRRFHRSATIAWCAPEKGTEESEPQARNFLPYRLLATFGANKGNEIPGCRKHRSFG
jgi:hypothetical protein